MADPTSGQTLSQLASSGGPSLLNFGSDLVMGAMNLHEQRQNRRFMRNMSNTEMQRRVRDLRAAGLNPMLAVGGHGLGGASTPHPQSSPIQGPKLDPRIGLESMAIRAGVQETQARTAKELAEAGKIKSETSFLNDSMEDRLLMQWVQVRHELEKKDLTKHEQDMLRDRMIMIEKEFELMENQITHSALDLDRMRAESSMYKLLGAFGAAGKAGLLRIPFGAMLRSKGAKRAGELGGSWRRLNIKTGELRR